MSRTTMNAACMAARAYRRVVTIVLLALAALVVLPASAALPPGISGAWFNPAQGGHGLSIEVLGDGRAIAYWFVYDPQGQPVHLYIDGTIDGRRIAGTAYRHDGLRFGDFDPAELVQRQWGTVAIDFADCQRGTLHYEGSGPAGAGYGKGDIAIERLSALKESACGFGTPNALPAGVYDAAFENLYQPPQFPGQMAAAIDPDGNFWATVPSPPSFSFVGLQSHPPLVTGKVGPLNGQSAGLHLLVQGDTAFGAAAPLAGYAMFGYATRQGNQVSARITFTQGVITLSALTLRSRADGAAVVSRQFDPAALAGTAFRANFKMQFVDAIATVTMTADGGLCMTAAFSEQPACAWTGQARGSHPGTGFFDFTLVRTTSPGPKAFSGRGWVEYEGGVPQRLVFVGSNQREGAGFVARRVTR